MTKRQSMLATISLLLASTLISGCMGKSEKPAETGNGIPLADYLSKGKGLMAGNYCSSPKSPFMKNNSLDDCSRQVGNLFDFCTNKELKGLLVPTINNKQQADSVARIVDDCVKAHHSGPEQVEAFRAKLKAAFEKKNPQPVDDATQA